MTTTEVAHKVKLIDGTFTPSEASDVINALIKEKINFHKLHRLSMCEGDCDSDTSFDDSRVAQLLQEKENFKTIYRDALISGKRVEIQGTLEVKIID